VLRYRSFFLLTFLSVVLVFFSLDRMFVSSEIFANVFLQIFKVHFGQIRRVGLQRSLLALRFEQQEQASPLMVA